MLVQMCFQLRLGIALKVAQSTFWYLLGILLLYVTISPDITQIKREVAVLLLQKQLYHMILFISTLIYYQYAFPNDFAVICNGFLDGFLYICDAISDVRIEYFFPIIFGNGEDL